MQMHPIFLLDCSFVWLLSLRFDLLALQSSARLSGAGLSGYGSLSRIILRPPCSRLASSRIVLSAWPAEYLWPVADSLQMMNAVIAVAWGCCWLEWAAWPSAPALRARWGNPGSFRSESAHRLPKECPDSSSADAFDYVYILVVDWVLGSTFLPVGDGLTSRGLQCDERAQFSPMIAFVFSVCIWQAFRVVD